MSYVTLCGRLGRDADLRTVGDGEVLNFSVAEDIGYGDKKKTQWWSCALWGKRGEKLAQYLTKGTAVTVIANDATVREYNAKDGTPKFELTCRVVDVVLQGGGKPRDGEPRQSEQVTQAPPPAAFDDDSVPF